MKHCNWCNSEVDIKAKVCPKCGKPIWEKKHKISMKLSLIFLGIMVILLILVIVAINNPVVHDCTGASEITLKEVQDKMKENHQNAEATFNHNYYKLNGKILHIYSKELEIQDIDSGYSIFVKFNDEFKNKILDLKVGDTIKYCGKMNIKNGSYNIENACIIEESE